MKKTFTVQVEIPATKVGLYEATKSAQMIAKGVEMMERKGGNYDMKAIHAFTQRLRGALGLYKFDVVVDNQHITDDREAEVIELFKSSLPATHKIISIN